MIMSTEFNWAMIRLGPGRATWRVQAWLLQEIERGNLVFGASVTRVHEATRISRANVRRAIAELTDAGLLQWDESRALVQFNPRWLWNGRELEGEHYEYALAEWDGQAVDKDANAHAQMDYLFGEPAA